MFIGIKELERHKLTFQESFAPGTIDFRTGEFRQVAPLQVELTAELEGREIHLVGRFSTRLGLNCARCVEPLERKVSANLDLLFRPVNSVAANEGDEIELAPEEREQCRCGPRPLDPRLAPLAAWAEKRKRPS
jgi:uncharacterized metal-binding protein YceD (DUF177 family)